jgi:hypothetical protein
MFGAGDRVLNDVGVFSPAPFPPSVNVADMNDDQLPDLVVADRYGYLRIFMNTGKHGEPQFTTNMVIPTFLGLTPRIHVCDWDGDRDKDIVFGNFFGDFQVMANLGSAKQPRFTTSMGLPRFAEAPEVSFPKLMLKRETTVTGSGGLGRARPANVGGKMATAHGVGELFVMGIYMAPWVCDWNNDGKLDLIFGEGTYSANSVRIAFNTGAAGKPSFSDEQIFYLAYGEGHEQLVPSIVDYNGDGIRDIMTGTRTGHIRLYKGTEKTPLVKTTFFGAKEPAAMEFDYNLPLQNLEVMEVMTAPFPYDMNEDGLFDIVMGSTKGLIYMALNQGTKTEPAFPKVEPIKGLNLLPDLVEPLHWGGNIGREGDCNSAGYLTSEEAIDIKTGLPPKDGQPGGMVVKPVEGKRFVYYRYMVDYPGWQYFGDNKTCRPGARALGSGGIGPMYIGKNYQFSFSYALVGGAVDCRFTSGEQFTKYNEEFDDYDSWSEERPVKIPELTPTGGKWQKITVNFTCPGTQRGQQLPFPMITVPGIGLAQRLTYHIGFQLPDGDCQLFLDGFSLKETL